jgi:hypothetical protein
MVERSTGEAGLPPWVGASRDVVAIAVVWDAARRNLEAKKEMKESLR